MPGYNHYASCTCGWCVNYGRRGAFVVVNGIDAGRAATILREFGADRSRAACFVDHNARCPVCNARVFYYANANGSRVFFDELGPPWTKHPCTDNRRPLSGSRALAFRPGGAVAEIRTSYELLGKPLELEWRLAVVADVQSASGRVVVTITYYGDPKPVAVRFVGDAVGIHAGDMVATKGTLVSYFDRVAGEQRIVAAGGRLYPVPRQPEHQEVALAQAEAAYLATGQWDDFVACWDLPPGAVTMRAEETPNFHCGDIDVVAITRAMSEEVRKAWLARKRSLQAMADTFNAKSITTACGLTWTPRRVYLLLKLMHWSTRPSVPAPPFARTVSPRPEKRQPKARPREPRHSSETPPAPPPRPAATTPNTLAEKLAVLGRVTRRDRADRK